MCTLKKKVLPYLLYMVNFNSATEASALINYNISQLGKCLCTIRTLQNKKKNHQVAIIMHF